jgi:rubrerythrin
MPEFMDPHNQMDADRPYTKDELIRALRKDLAAEEEAASLYTAHAEMCTDPEIKQVILDIADEERVHVGEFQELIDRLSADEEELIQQGRGEVQDQIGGEGGPEEIAREMDTLEIVAP